MSRLVRWYARVVAQCFTWLEGRFPEYMSAARYRDPVKYFVGQLLRLPCGAVFIFLPLVLPLFIWVSVPVSDNVHAMGIVAYGMFIMYIIVSELVHELRKRDLRGDLRLARWVFWFLVRRRD